jgi:DNA-binding transcriptional regulator YiaG
MKPELKARIDRLARAPATGPVLSGSPVVLVIRPANGLPPVLTISAIKSLFRRGTSLAKAKRTVEAMVEHGEAVIHLPTVEDVGVLADELLASGVAAKRLATTSVDVKAVRARLGLTQEQFALRFGLEIDALQNWEQGRCQPDKASASYLRAIAAIPRQVAEAQEEALV